MIPERFALPTYAVMRIVFGAMFMTYGLQKLGLLGGQGAPTASILGVAMAIELIGGALIAIGLFTRPAAFLSSGQMAVAYFMAHQPQGLLPVQNQGIPPVLFCFAFLHMAAFGAGTWSLDNARRK
jgi:putative oxidoreductase